MPDTLPTSLLTALKAFAVFAGVAGLALGLRHLAFRALRRWASSTATRVDDIALESIRVPSIVWCMLLGLDSAITMLHLPARPGALAQHAVFALLVISVTAAVANLTGEAIRHVLKEQNLAIHATGLSLTIITGTVWMTGGLVLLSGLGVSIAPILTALGVGGIAVALALQDTLSNFFAGIHLLIEKPVRVGDFVRLGSGHEGYVADIGWRTTRIRMTSNNLVIIPNNMLTQSILTNYSLPEPSMAVAIPVHVSYAADPARIEQVLVEEASRAVGQIAGLLADPAPVARLIPGFGESALMFTLSVHVREFEDQFPVQHELRARIVKRFAEEHITIPVPQQDIHITRRPSRGEGEHT